VAKGGCYDAVCSTLHRMHKSVGIQLRRVSVSKLRNDVMKDLMTSIGPRNMARLFHTALLSSIPADSSSSACTQLSQNEASLQLQQHYPSIRAAFLPLLKTNLALRDQVLKWIILSGTRSLDIHRKGVICCVAHFLVACNNHSINEFSDTNNENKDKAQEQEQEQDTVDANANVLVESMIQVAQYWCERTFVDRTNGALQRQVTHFLLLGLKHMNDGAIRNDDEAPPLPDTVNTSKSRSTMLKQQVDSTLQSLLIKGVTNRLNSSIGEVRKDGMRIAEAFAPLVSSNDDDSVNVKFEELDAERGVFGAEDDVLWRVLDESQLENYSKTDPAFTDPEVAPILNHHTDNDNESRSSEKVKKKKQQPRTVRDILQMDPDAAYDSDDESSTSSDDNETRHHDRLLTFTSTLDNDNDNDNDEDDAASSATDSSSSSDSNNSFNSDDLQPWTHTLNDDETDLLTIQPPRYLRECLTLLRANKDEDHAYSKHEQALKQIVPILLKNPLDLNDVCTSLMHELVHMENLFDMEGFHEMRLQSLQQLAVRCPRACIECLGANVLFDGVSLGTRMEVLDVLVFVAEELSGAHNNNNDDDPTTPSLSLLSSRRSVSCVSQDAQRRFEMEQHISNANLVKAMVFKPRGATSGKRRLVSDANHYDAATATANLDSTTNEDATATTTKTRRWGRKKHYNHHPQPTFQNKFQIHAPLYFYTLLGGFVRTKDDDASIWDEHGLLLSKFLYTLGMFVQSCGAPDVANAAMMGPMAYDLYQLAWSFRLAESANIRQAVLFAVCTAMQYLSLEQLLLLLEVTSMGANTNDNDDCNVVRYLNDCASQDPDECCRELAREVCSSLNVLLSSSSSSSDERHAMIGDLL